MSLNLEPARLTVVNSVASTTLLSVPTLETTQGQIDGFFSQLPFKCYLPEVASVGD